MDSAEAQKRLESCHRLPSTVMSKNKLIQIGLELTATDPVVSAHEPLLQVADGAISQGNHRLGATAQFGPERLRARGVLEADLLKTAEALEAIGTDQGIWSNVLGDKTIDGCSLEVRDHSHAKTSRGPTALLHRNQNQCGPAPLELAAASETGLGTANPSVINLNLTTQGFASEVHRRSSEFVKDHPSGLVAPKSELTLEKQCRNTRLSVVIR
jgi:hypothetical protein